MPYALPAPVTVKEPVENTPMGLSIVENESLMSRAQPVKSGEIGPPKATGCKLKAIAADLRSGPNEA